MKFQDVPLPQFAKRFVLIPYRFLIAFRYYQGSLARIFTWLFHSRETSNFTYDLTTHNRNQLVGFLSVVTGIEPKPIFEVLSELDQDLELRSHIDRLTMDSAWRYKSDTATFYGKRLGWYALIRLLKPKVVVETGIDKGLGTIVMASALIRNKQEGFPGKIFGVDINPAAGFLIQNKYKEVSEILYGDSLTVLKEFQPTIDLFINDSDHSEEHEAAEYDIIQNRLSSNSVVIGDNAHVTDKLFQFSIKTGRQFLFFQENPKDHWYPGCGIGVSYKK